MSQDNDNKLANMLMVFVEDTVTGQLTGMYRAYNKQLKTLENRHNIILGAVVNYYNHCYKSFLKKNDDYVVENYNKFIACHNHSIVCLSHILLNMTLLYHKLVNYDLLDYSNYDNFKKSAISLVKLMVSSTRHKFSKCISHKCSGEDIKNCDPNEDLFSIKPL